MSHGRNKGDAASEVLFLEFSSASKTAATRSVNFHPNHSQLREQNGRRNTMNDRQSQRRSRRRAQGLRPERISRPNALRQTRRRPGRSERFRRPDDRPHVAGILHAHEHDNQRRSGQEALDRRLSRPNQSGDPLRRLCIRNAGKQFVGGSKHRHTGCQHGRDARKMARPRFAKENRLHRQARPQRRFNEANTLDAHDSVVALFARKRGAESLEPAVLTARNQGGGSTDGLSRV